jgi:uncharacterized low-complexity protein
MSNQPNRTKLSVAIGAALTASLAGAPIAQADTANPFGLTELASGYMLGAAALDHHNAPTQSDDDTARDDEGRCGEGRCGEGRCGADHDADAEDKDEEGRCGEGQCGADHDDDADSDADKDDEGRCGEGRCGGNA